MSDFGLGYNGAGNGTIFFFCSSSGIYTLICVFYPTSKMTRGDSY